jgi:two-component system probable response regulator PhcQ
MQRDVEQCRALANSIGNLARGLGSPSAVRASSMADTISEVIEQGMTWQSEPWRSHRDGSQDFTYRVPREIMKFVLANLLRSTTKLASRAGSIPQIDLISGTEHNEVRIVLASGGTSVSLEDDAAWRTVRCALWAFGGELLSSTDENLCTFSLTMCLPKA